MKKFLSEGSSRSDAVRSRKVNRCFGGVICAALIFCAAFALTLSASLVTAKADDTEPMVYYDNSGNPYDESGYYIYMVGDQVKYKVNPTYSTVEFIEFYLDNSVSDCLTEKTVSGTTGYFTCNKEGTCVISYKVISSYTFNDVYDYNTKTGSKKVRVVDYIDNISFPSASVTLSPGDTKDMAVETTDDYYSVTMSEAVDGFYTYSSSDTSVATVDGEGKVTAVSAGTATITCTTANGVSAECEVTVKDPEVTKITLSASSVTLKIGKTKTLKYTISPDDAETTVTFTSSNKSVATVSSAGKITAKKAGTATITAKTANGKTATCKVTVKKNPTSISLNKSAVTILVGKTKTLKATVKPSSAVSDVTWKSSKTSVATVDENGKITAKKAGTAVITATSSNGLTAKCTVTVKKVNATKIKLNKTKLTINKGKSKTLTYTLTPSNATSSVKWSSSNTSVATVSSSGKITAKKAGTCTITARTSTGKTAKCKVTVKAPITSVKLSASSKTLTVGKSATLKATINPSSTTSSKKLTWSSSDKSVATVSSSGKVTAKSAGTCTITVRTSNGKTAKCKISVIIPITGVSLSSTAESVYVGETAELTATVSPSNTTQSTDITWTSSDTSVAAVSSSGVMTGVAEGSCVITAETSNGKTAVCNVTVSLPGPDSITMYKDSYDLKVGNSQSIIYYPDPSSANGYITWTSSDTSVAEITVTDGVLVSGKSYYIQIKCTGEGTATITGEAPNGVTASCTVNVTWREAEEVELSLLVDEDDLTVGSTYLISDIIECTITPSNAKQEVTWTVNSPNYDNAQIIDNEYLEITGTGIVRIYAAAENGVESYIQFYVSE